MGNLQWHIELKRLDLKYTWAISRNASDFKTNAFVTVSDGNFIGIGEAAPNIRYGETPESLLAEFERFKQETKGAVEKLERLGILLSASKFPNALRFAIESAFTHYLANKQKKSVASLLGLPEAITRDTAYTIPIMAPEKLAAYFQEYRPHRFKYVKLKVNDENLIDFVRQVRILCPNTFIIDANEAYQNPDQLLADLLKTDDRNIAFIEQPFPAAELSAFQYLKAKSPFPIFADESVTDQADFHDLKTGFHGINVKLMKAGGYLNAIKLLQEAKKHGMGTMVGCMVETGLGISSGLHISSLADFLDLDSFLILKENPFDLVEEHNGKVFLKEDSLHA